MVEEKYFSVKFPFSQRLRIFAAEIFRKGSGELPQIIGGKNTGAYESVRPLKRTPLHGGGEKQGIKSEKRIQLLREEANQDQRGAVQKDGKKLQIEMPDPGQYHCGGKPRHINEKPENPKQPVCVGSSGKIHGKADQVRRLGGTENIAAVQQRITAHKSADQRHVKMNPTFCFSAHMPLLHIISTFLPVVYSLSNIL